MPGRITPPIRIPPADGSIEARRSDAPAAMDIGASIVPHTETIVLVGDGSNQSPRGILLEEADVFVSTIRVALTRCLQKQVDLCADRISPEGCDVARAIDLA